MRNYRILYFYLKLLNQIKEMLFFKKKKNIGNKFLSFRMENSK